MEDVWEKTYDDRREQYKLNASVIPSSGSESSDKTSNDSSTCLSDGSAFRNAFLSANETIEIRQDVQGSEPEKNVDIEAHIAKWTLNKEQAHAFRIIAEHSLQNKPEQLRMFLAGPGGTGKSRVIDALREFFELRGQSRRFRLAAYTGVAARNIRGMTLHSALCLKQR
ncbi:hypothetical protein B0H12DRAFT_1018764, partial [Mycena haematopus]